MPTASLNVGLASLRLNPLRTFLSTLGVIVGVGSMVSVLAMGDGVEKYAREQVARTTDLQAITISPSTVQRLDGVFMRRADIVQLTFGDVQALRAAVPQAASGQIMVSGGTMARRDSAAPSRGLSITAALPTLAEERKVSLRDGQFFSDEDVTRSNAVVVLTAAAADTIASAHAPSFRGFAERRAGARGGRGAGDSSATRAGKELLGRTILLQQRAFRVVGITAPEERQRLEAFIPYSSAEGVMLGIGGIALPARIILVAARVEDVAAMKAGAERFFARRYGATWRERIDIVANSARVEQLTQALTVFKLLMGAITGVSLLVGGIGIMNVLLAAVAERTREIGIRKAAGARNRDILVQFLSEAVAITSAGAALGVLLGLSIAFLTAAIMRSQTEAPVHAAITVTTVMVAAAASVIVGAVFGLYPALRAARLSPIDAIRHE